MSGSVEIVNQFIVLKDSDGDLICTFLRASIKKIETYATFSEGVELRITLDDGAQESVIFETKEKAMVAHDLLVGRYIKS